MDYKVTVADGHVHIVIQGSVPFSFPPVKARQLGVAIRNAADLAIALDPEDPAVKQAKATVDEFNDAARRRQNFERTDAG